MTREQARERVLDYAYGELPVDEAAAFEALLRDDPELSAALEDVLAVRRAAAQLPAPELPGAVRRRILDAAGAASRRRAWAARLERVQAMFLSPAFLGAAGVLAAVVVGIHVLDPGGGGGPTSSGDRGEVVLDEAPLVATSARPSPVADEAPASVPAPASAPAPVAAADETEAAGAQRPVPERAPAASTGARARAKSATVAREATPPRKQEAELVPMGDAAPGLGGLVGSGMGGGGAAATGAVGAIGAAPQGYGRAGPAKRAAGAAPAAPAATPATAPVDDVATRSEEAEAETEAEAPRRTAATRADGDGAFATPPPAAAKAAAQAPAEDADRVTTTAASAASAESAAPDPADLLAEARAARARGRPADALSLCRRALTLAPTGDLLADLLAEAAELALSLSRDAEARGYLDRLERLPGGAERARAIRDR